MVHSPWVRSSKRTVRYVFARSPLGTQFPSHFGLGSRYMGRGYLHPHAVFPPQIDNAICPTGEAFMYLISIHEAPQWSKQHPPEPLQVWEMARGGVADAPFPDAHSPDLNWALCSWELSSQQGTHKHIQVLQIWGKA